MNKKVKTKISTLFMLVVLLAQTLTPVVTVFAEDTTMSTQSSSEVQSINESTSQVEVGQGETTTSNTIPVVPNTSTTPPSTTASSEVSASTELSSENPTSESQEVVATEEAVEEDEEPAQSSTEVSETTTESTETSETTSTESTENKKEVRKDTGLVPGNIITDFKITDRFGNEGTPEKPLDPNSPEGVSVHCKWELPTDHDIQSGDKFEFDLPDWFLIDEIMTGTLSDGPTKYGEYTIEPNGKVTLTFNENVGKDKVFGEVRVDTWLDIQKLENETIKEIKNPIQGGEENYVLYLESKNGETINKQGTIDKGFQGTFATWIVDINTSLEKLNNPSVSDKIPDGMTYTADSLVVTKLKVGLDGTVKDTKEVLDPSKYDVTGNLNISFKNLTEEEIYGAYRLSYKTDIMDPNIQEGTQSWSNSATLTNNGEVSNEVVATVSSNYGEEIKKTEPKYNDKAQTFNWEVFYNLSGKEIAQEKAKIEDTWTPVGVMALKEQDLKIYSIELDQEGNVIPSKKTLIDSSTYTLTLKDDKSGFLLEFNSDVSLPYVIEYETKILQNDGNIITNGGAVNNKVTTGTGKESGNSGTFTQSGIIKTSPRYDVNAKTIDWEIKINQNNYQMNNLILEDTFVGDGLTLKEKTVELVNSSGVKLVSGKDYQLTSIPGEPGGFTIALIGSYASTKDSFTLKYQTDFERNSDGTAIYKNKAGIKWTDGTKEYESNTAEVDGTPDGYTGPNGVKSGRFNPVDKEITWEINTNYARLDITKKDYKIEDLLAPSQKYVDGSLEVYTYTIKPTGEIDTETRIMEGFTLSETVEGEQEKITVVFDESARKNGTLGIRFRTKFKNDLINEKEVENTALVITDGVPLELKAEVTAVNNGNNFSNKSGTQKGNRIHWTIELNPNGSMIEDFKLTDIVAEAGKPYSILIEGSEKVYKASIAEDGSLIQENNPIDGTLYNFKNTSKPATGEQSFELTFPGKITAPYILTYDTLIDVSGAFTISNKYEISGSNIEKIPVKEPAEVAVKMSGSSGSGKGTVGSLKIVKQELDGTTTPITGEAAKAASFELWNAAGDVRIRQAINLNEEGTLTFANIRSSQYRIVEVTPPTGYTVNPEYADRGGNDKGKLIDLKDLVDGEIYEFSAEDPRFQVNLEKRSENGELLNGAVFDLYDSTTNNIVSGYENLTITGGKLALSIDPTHIGTSIIIGREYYVKEQTGIKGYLLNKEASKPFTFELNTNGTQTIPTAAIINYQGSVKWKKTNKEGTGLAGAVFEVLDATGQVVEGKTGTTGTDGTVTITGLAPGKYKLREKTAPANYIKNPTLSSEFTIDEKANGKPDPFVISDAALINYQGRAEMKKIDKDKTPLSGAEFVIKKKDSNHFYNGVNTNGAINWITNQTNVAQENKFISNADGVVVGPLLGLGSYQFVEVKAPVGYIINTSGIDFEITATDNQTDNELGIVDKTANPLVNYKGSVELTKRGHNNVELPDVSFRLLDSSKKVVTGKENLKTDSTGKIKVEELSPGVYYFEEKSAADDSYVLNPKLLEFEIPTASDGIPDVIKIEFQNYRGSAKLTKTLNNEPAGTSVGRTAGFYFRNSNNEYYQGIDDVSGAAIFNITPKVLDVVIIGNQGTKTVEGLAPGKYYWEEVKAPDGYLLNTSKKDVEIKASYTGEPAAESVSMTNYQGSAELSKINESGKGIDLINSGVEFKVYKKDGLTEITTAQISYSADGKVRVSNLAPGTYLIKEVKAPKNYVLNPTPIEFKILDSAEGEPKVVKELKLINYQGSAELTKKNSLNEDLDLAGAEFKVYQVQSDGKLGKEPQGLVTINGNKVKVTGLGSGEYKFVEVTAPVGYIINTDGPTFTIEDETNKELSLKTGMKLINYQGSAQLVKKSGENLIAGAEFKVVDGEGKDVQSELISDAQGIVTVEGLAPGEYTFVETKPAPGYVLDAQPKAFTISNTYQGTPAIVSAGELTNRLTSFTFTKQVEAKQGLNNQPLANVVFAIKNSDGKYYNGTLNQPSESWVDHVEQISDAVKTSLTSDTEGKVSVNGLTPGTYIVEEIDVPTGIVKQEGTLLTITVDERGTVSFEDSNSTIVNARQTIASISGEKIWGDSNNVFNTRPKSIELTLYRQIGENGVPEKVPGIDPLRVTGSNDEKWSYTFTNLVTHNDNREEYIFTVKETPIKGYTASYDGMNVTNTLNLISVSGKKTWIGDKNVEELSRPESITLILQRNGEDATDKDGKVITKVVTGPNWEYTFIDLPEFEQAGTEYTYSVKELSVPGYIAKPSGMNVTNTFQPMTITGQKIWQGDENIKDLTRPDKITVQLFRKGQTKPIAIQDISGPNWKYNFEGLPKFDGENPYIYTVEEVGHNGYAATTSYDNKTITNTLNTTSVPVQKIWDDASDKSSRPDSITFELLAQVEGVSGVTKIAEHELEKPKENPDTWSYTFENLPTHNKEVKKFIYTVREKTVPDGSYATSETEIVDGIYQITNTLIAEDELIIKKVWEDQTDTSSRPAFIEVQLYRQVDGKDKEKVGEPRKLTPKDELNPLDWQIKFTGLAASDKEGNKYNYFVEEVTDSASYLEPKISKEGQVSTITNTLDSVNIPVEKIWDDSTDLSLRPDSVTVDLYRQIEGEDTATKVEGHSLTLSEADSWKGQFTGLAKEDKSGNAYIYSVKEQEVKGYTPTVVPGLKDGFVITNKLDLTEVSVTKVWDDFSNKYGLRPESIELSLMVKQGEQLVPVTKKVKNSEGQIVEEEVKLTLSGDMTATEWTGKFENLTKFDHAGQLVQYYVLETAIKAYKEVSVQKVNDKQQVSITNELRKTEIPVTKTWLDENNRFGLRPEEITVSLYQNDKLFEAVAPFVIKADKDGNWTHTFTDLPEVDAEGNAYEYTIFESEVTGYEGTIDQKTGEITNSLVTIDIPVTKVWEDTLKGKENYYQSRPESITIRLKQNGKEIAQVPAVKVVDKDGNWSHVFRDLPKLDKDGEAYEYEVTEDTVDKYNSKIDVNESNKVTITNTRKTYAIGDYTWIDTDKDGVQDPDEKPLVGVIVELFDEKGNPILDKDGKPMTTTTDKNGRYIFDELEDGKYTIKFTLTKEQSDMYEFTKQDAGEDDKSDSDADELTGWTTTITLNDDSKELTKDYTDQKFKATEGIDPTWDAGVILREKIEVTGTKVWVGGPKVKPTIELQLYRNGKAFGDPVELKDGTTTYTWKNLYKTDTNKKPYVYTVKEVGIPSEYNKTEEGLKVTNTRKTYAIVDYTWIDTDKDGIQDKNEPVLPGVKVELFDENGKKISETTTDKNGRYIFDELESGKYKVKFTLTDEQKKLYKFTKRHSGDAAKDSNADDEGWTIDIDLNEKNAALTKDYQDQAFKASEGVDPTWDAGVILLDVPVKPTDPKDPKPELPQMGEASNPFLLTSLGILLIGSVVGVVTTRRRRQG